MSKDNTIRLTVNAEPGSLLKKAVMQTLKDMEANRKRLKDDYAKKVEKQRKKIERGQ
jgi:hypothetical protein